MDATLSANTGPGFRGRLKRLLAPAGGKKRWKPHVFVNIVSAVVIAWVLTFTWIQAHWHLGVDIQRVQCLPYEFFLVSQTPPDEIVRGKIYEYESTGLAPVVKDGTKMTKIAAAVAGDEIVVDARGVLINGQLWGPINPAVLQKTGKTLEGITTRYIIPEGKVLMLGTLPRSYDGRYWGLIDATQVQGRAIALW